MRVLMICTEKLPVPPVRGGAIQTYIAAVAPHLAARHTLTILSVQDPELPNEERRNGVTFVRIPGGNLEVYRSGISQFLQDRGSEFDLIHLFNRPKLVNTVREGAPQARIILSMHNDMFEPQKIEPDQATAALAEIERVVTVSDYVGSRICELYPEANGKCRTIYSGVDLNQFVPVWSSEGRDIAKRLKAEHGLPDGPVILFVGRLSPKKGVDVLVRAMPYVARKYPKASLVLVGSKWYGEDRISDYVGYVRSLAARSPIPVVSTGFVTPDDVHRWFTVGDLFVCTSLWQEPLARVHYEAMAAGLPIITTSRGGNPEVVAGKGNGLVVDTPEDPQVLAQAIISMLGSSSQRQQMGKTGRDMAVRQFGWDRVAADILSVWEGRG